MQSTGIVLFLLFFSRKKRSINILLRIVYPRRALFAREQAHFQLLRTIYQGGGSEFYFVLFLRNSAENPFLSASEQRFAEKSGRISCKLTSKIRLLPRVRTRPPTHVCTKTVRLIHRGLSTLSTMLSTYCGVFGFFDVYKFILSVHFHEYIRASYVSLIFLYKHLYHKW